MLLFRIYFEWCFLIGLVDHADGSYEGKAILIHVSFQQQCVGKPMEMPFKISEKTESKQYIIPYVICIHLKHLDTTTIEPGLVNDMCSFWLEEPWHFLQHQRGDLRWELHPPWPALRDEPGNWRTRWCRCIGG